MQHLKCSHIKKCVITFAQGCTHLHINIRGSVRTSYNTPIHRHYLFRFIVYCTILFMPLLMVYVPVTRAFIIARWSLHIHLLIYGVDEIVSYKITLGELRSGVTEFATIYTTGSHRFLLQIRNDERGEIILRQKKKVNLTYHLFMYYFHRTLTDLGWGKATKNRQIVSFEN